MESTAGRFRALSDGHRSHIFGRHRHHLPAAQRVRTDGDLYAALRIPDPARHHVHVQLRTRFGAASSASHVSHAHHAPRLREILDRAVYSHTRSARSHLHMQLHSGSLALRLPGAGQAASQDSVPG